MSLFSKSHRLAPRFLGKTCKIWQIMLGNRLITLSGQLFMSVLFDFLIEWRTTLLMLQKLRVVMTMTQITWKQFWDNQTMTTNFLYLAAVASLTFNDNQVWSFAFKASVSGIYFFKIFPISYCAQVLNFNTRVYYHLQRYQRLGDMYLAFTNLSLVSDITFSFL